MDHKGAAILAGALGGVMRTITLRERVWPEGIINVVAGGICALYLTPLVEPMLRPVLGAISVPPDGTADIFSPENFQISWTIALEPAG